MLMNMLGGRRDHCIQSLPRPSYQNPHKDVCVAVCAVLGGCGRGDGEAGGVGHWTPQPGHSPVSVWPPVTSDRGPGPGDRVSQCPMYGPDPVGCAVVPWW